MKLSLKICFYIYLFRLLNCLLSRTFFQPDEYYQSLEIAHRIVFGYGYETWEWKSNSNGAIRSPIHPFLFVPTYWFLKKIKLDETKLLIILPKFVQAGIATITDIATYSIASNLINPKYAPASLACSLTSFFNAYAGVRTLSNSLETALTAIALAHWPWITGSTLNSWSNLIISISFIAITIIVRPSSILFWLALTLTILKHSSGNARIDIIALFSVIGIISALICFIIDSSFYGFLTFTPMNFIKQNLFKNLSNFYGMNSWHFYFTQGFPFLNLSLFPAVILGMISIETNQSIYEGKNEIIKLKLARFTILFTMIGLSFIQHKEFRFIQALIPLFNCFASRIMVNNYLKYKKININNNNFIENYLSIRFGGFLFRSLISFSFAFYFLRFHYHAQVDVINFLGKIKNEEMKSVGFLMPCHSTPWQSHLHKFHLATNGTEERIWMLNCDPPLNSHYSDESSEFYKDEMLFLKNRFPKQVNPDFPATGRRNESVNLIKYEWPSHLIMFESLYNKIQEYLIELNYKIIYSKFNSLRHDDQIRRSGNVIVLFYSNKD